MNILSMIKVKILVLIKWSYTSPKSCYLLSLEPKKVSKSWARRNIGVCWINTRLPLSTVTEEEASLVLKYVMELMEISNMITDLQE